MKSFVIGFDISKDKVNFCLNEAGIKVHEGEILNDLKSLKATIKQIQSLVKSLSSGDQYSIRAVMEYTGIYNNLLVSALTKTPIEINVVHAANIKSSSGIDRLKNDKVDALKIAEYGYRFADKLTVWKPLSDNMQTIKILSAKRERLVNMKKSAVQGVDDFKKFHGSAYSKACENIDKQVATALDEAIQQIEQEINKLIEQDSELKTNYDLIQTIPGFGPVTALALLILSDNMLKFKNAKQLACYCGIAPFEKSSGKYHGRARVSHAANKRLKTLLHMCSVSVIKTNTDFAKWYNKKVDEGKNPMSALNALRNKMLNTAFAVVSNKTQYSATYSYQNNLAC